MSSVTKTILFHKLWDSQHVPPLTIALFWYMHTTGAECIILLVQIWPPWPTDQHKVSNLFCELDPYIKGLLPILHLKKSKQPLRTSIFPLSRWVCFDIFDSKEIIVVYTQKHNRDTPIPIIYLHNTFNPKVPGGLGNLPHCSRPPGGCISIGNRYIRDRLESSTSLEKGN